MSWDQIALYKQMEPVLVMVEKPVPNTWLMITGAWTPEVL